MRRFVKASVIGLVTAGLGIALAATQPGASLEERFGLSWLFWARGPVPPPTDVTVVSLDRHSAEQLNLPEKIRDWPRTVHATLIDRLTEADVSTIVFDLILERERELDQDLALAKAIAEAKRVVLFEALDLQRQPILGVEGVALGLIQTERLREPLPAMAEAAAGLGPFPLPIVPDRVSQFWAFKPGAGGRPTLPATALQHHALSVHTEWLTLLRRAGFDGLDELPTATSALGRAVELRQMMIRLREAFHVDTTLGKRLRAELANADLDVAGRRLLSALIALYDGPDSRYVNFYGPAGQIRTRSLHEFIGTEASSETRGSKDLADRVVFVGQSELFEPHNDAFITVYSRPDGVKISGVEIAATAFSNLLDGRLIDVSPYWFLAIAGFGLVIGMIAGLLPALWAVPACLAITTLYFTGATFAFSRESMWLPTAVPLLAELPLGLFAGLFMQYREARRARENLSKAIRYYLPDKIAEGFSNAPVAPLMEDEETYAYCLVTDASGFTSLAETMTSKQLKPFLEAYLAILFEAVEAHGGRVTDSVGDGITAAWTSPNPDPAIAAKACEAALAIDREVERFNTHHDPLRLPTRIGLNAGWVTLGHVGGAGRFTYTVVGDAVNTASRIEQLNKHLGTRILATQAVVDGVQDLAMRPLGKFQLFGKEEVLEMVELLNSTKTKYTATYKNTFDQAIALLQKTHYQKAEKIFNKISHDSEDKTLNFYLNVCRECIKGSNLPDGIIRLKSK